MCSNSSSDTPFYDLSIDLKRCEDSSVEMVLICALNHLETFYSLFSLILFLLFHNYKELINKENTNFIWCSEHRCVALTHWICWFKNYFLFSILSLLLLQQNIINRRQKVLRMCECVGGEEGWLSFSCWFWQIFDCLQLSCNGKISKIECVTFGAFAENTTQLTFIVSLLLDGQLSITNNLPFGFSFAPCGFLLRKAVVVVKAIKYSGRQQWPATELSLIEPEWVQFFFVILCKTVECGTQSNQSKVSIFQTECKWKKSQLPQLPHIR